MKSFLNKIIKSKLFVNATLCFVLSAVFVVIAVTPIKTSVLPTANIQRAIYKGNESCDGVAYTFNVYQGTTEVNKILDILSNKGVKATFFVGGCWADDNTETLIRIRDEGHEIGSHGYYHKDHAKLSYDQNLQEMKYAHQLIKGICEIDMRNFAPPSGSFSSNTLKACETMGYRAIMWTNDTIDWRDQDSDKIYSRAIKNCSAGNIILMHPTEKTTSVLSKIIDYYLQNGLTGLTVSDIIKGV